MKSSTSTPSWRDMPNLTLPLRARDPCRNRRSGLVPSRRYRSPGDVSISGDGSFSGGRLFLSFFVPFFLFSSEKWAWDHVLHPQTKPRNMIGIYVHIFDMVYTDMLPKESNGFRTNWWKPRVKGAYRKSDVFW